MAGRLVGGRLRCWLGLGVWAARWPVAGWGGGLWLAYWAAAGLLVACGL